MKWTSNDTSVDPQELFLLATYNVSEIVNKIEVRFNHADNNGNKGATINSEDIIDSVQEQRHNHLGRCYTFRPHSDMRTLGVDSIRTYL